MSYQGVRARTADDESHCVFKVSKVRVDPDGRMREVLWTQVDAKTGHDVGAPSVVPVADVIDAIHDGARVAAVFSRPGSRVPERFFVVVPHAQGGERIALDGGPSAGRDVSDIETLQAQEPQLHVQGTATASAAGQTPASRSHARTFAVSQVELDVDGRIVAVRWGRVDTVQNAWASAEEVARVATVVQALREGDAVFALFPGAHGHLPERRFVTVDYDDGRQTIVLDGPATHEREIHDMDRLEPVAR